MQSFHFHLSVTFLVLILSSTVCKKSKKENMQDAGNQVRLSFYFFNRSNRNGVRLFREKLPENFDNTSPTFVVLHGMGGSHLSACQIGIRQALLEKLAANIIVPSYTNSSALYTLLYRDIARRVGNFLLKERVNAANTHVIGASLGAQIAGVMGRLTSFVPRSIYALDPAGPIFDRMSDNERLSVQSANYVQVLHTNAGVYGAVSPLGNDDVYVNGGNSFPCCAANNVCKHSASCELFVRTIEFGVLPARLCANVQQARASLCRGPNIEVGYASPLRLSLESSYKQKVYLGDSVWKPDPQEEKSPWRAALIECAKQYCYTAVLHGVKYLAEPRRPHLERFSWSLVLLSLVGVAIHLLYVTSIADLSGPLLINLQSSNYPIWNFNFPAVTLCPHSKLSRSLSKKWTKNMQLPLGMTEDELMDLLPNLLHMVDFAGPPELIDRLNSVLELNNVSAHELYLNISVPCRDLLVQCRLNGERHPCEHLFKTIRTTEGYCCSFNYFGVSSQFYLNRYHIPSDVTPKNPLRVSTSGKNSGLSVLVRKNSDTFGTLMSSQGVKVLIHVATNYPDHLAVARLVQPGHGEHFALYPTLVAAGDEIRSIHPNVRNCYFFDEKDLKGFQQYSYKSCIFNCRINIFNELCGCVPFYYPKLQDGIRTCSLKDVRCLTQFKYEIQTLRKNFSIALDQDNTAPCDCKPQCNELSYGIASSTYKLYDHLKTSKYHHISSFQDVSEVNVYFKALFGTKYQRLEHTTTYQMLANFGGLLGMFMGFSFISVFEIIYCFTLRICFRMYLNKQDKTEVEAY